MLGAGDRRLIFLAALLIKILYSLEMKISIKKVYKKCSTTKHKNTEQNKKNIKKKRKNKVNQLIRGEIIKKENNITYLHLSPNSA